MGCGGMGIGLCWLFATRESCNETNATFGGVIVSHKEEGLERIAMFHVKILAGSYSIPIFILSTLH